ncbi:MAG: hypothetical protein AB7I33_12695 [Gemmatimonadales bacterium]
MNQLARLLGFQEGTFGAEGGMDLNVLPDWDRESQGAYTAGLGRQAVIDRQRGALGRSAGPEVGLGPQALDFGMRAAPWAGENIVFGDAASLRDAFNASQEIGPAMWEGRWGDAGEAALGMGMGMMGVAPMVPRVPRGLPMDEASVAARAEAGGFTVPAFHGTDRGSFQSFDPASRGSSGSADSRLAYFFSDSAPAAENYISRQHYMRSVEGMEGEVAALQAQIDEIERRAAELRALAGTPSARQPGWFGMLEEAGNLDRQAKAIHDQMNRAREVATAWHPDGNVMPVLLRMENPDTWDMGRGFYSEAEFTDILQRAKREGHDSVAFENVFDPNGYSMTGRGPLQTTYAVFNPNQIRSRFAVFDPKRYRSRDILAGVGGAGLLGLGATQFDEEDQPPAGPWGAY